MEITKAEAKAGLGVETDAALARFLNISRQALSRYGDDDPLAGGLQWQLRARRPDKFPAPTQPAANDDTVEAA